MRTNLTSQITVFIIILFVILVSCKKEQKTKFDEGIYCLKSYIDKDNFESRYIEYFLIKVTKDKIIKYGTVNTWGNISKRNFELEKKYIKNDSTIIVSVFTGVENESLIDSEFLKLNGAEKIINENGINREEFVKYLNKNLISGTYKQGIKKVKFSNDGKIDNLDSLKTFSINPRFGTCWWYDYRTIKINNQLWKFDFTKKYFILTKYLPRDDRKEEMAQLSNIKIILER